MSFTKKYRQSKKTPWSKWSKIAPNINERISMKKKCGTKCFLGPQNSFPICAKNTCKINKKGLWSAYIRAKQWGKKHTSYKGRSQPKYSRKVYTKIANKAYKQIHKN